MSTSYRVFDFRWHSKASGRVNGVMSNADQCGRWVPDADIYARAFLGGSNVDFSQAIFTQPVINVHSSAVCGRINIVVPPGVVVEENGRAIMGKFKADAQDGRQAHSSGITIRVTGASVLANVAVFVNSQAAQAQVVSREEADKFLCAGPFGYTSRKELQTNCCQAPTGHAKPVTEAKTTSPRGRNLDADEASPKKRTGLLTSSYSRF